MKIHEKIQQAFINIEALGLHIPEQFILLNLEYGSYLVLEKARSFAQMDKSMP